MQIIEIIIYFLLMAVAVILLSLTVSTVAQFIYVLVF